MPVEIYQTQIRGVVELRSQSFHDARGAFFNAFRARRRFYADC